MFQKQKELKIQSVLKISTAAFPENLPKTADITNFPCHEIARICWDLKLGSKLALAPTCSLASEVRLAASGETS